jgi:hypothetical protein
MAGVTDDPCCASGQQRTCCEPGDKADCCGHERGCGCGAGARDPRAEVDIRPELPRSETRP